jgi:Fic family protein
MQPFVPQHLPLKKIDWTKFIHLIGEANAQVARYDGLLKGMQNPAVLLSPLKTREAVLSSKIEGTQATLQEVLKYEANPKEKTKKYEDIQEVINYRKAMNQAVTLLQKYPLSLNIIKKIHYTLLNSVRGRNKDLGNFRKIQVWIGKEGTPIDMASFIPPEPHLIKEHLYNWEKYIHFKEKDILVQLAILHAQFEIIHPFLDGNGRLGRIFMPLFLYSKKLLAHPMLYLSEYFEKNKKEYLLKLKNISKKNDWESWIEYFLIAVIDQSKNNALKATNIYKLYEESKEQISEITSSKYSIKAQDFIFSYPIFNTSDFISESKIPKRSGLRILKVLTDSKLIDMIEERSGKRSSIYIFPKLLKITD